MSFADVLGQELSSLGMSKSELAKKASIPDGTVYSWFQKKAATPSIEHAYRVALVVGKPLEYFLRGGGGASFGIRPEDPWILANLSFLADCRDLPQDQFMTQARVIHFLAEEERQRKLSRESEKHG